MCCTMKIRFRIFGMFHLLSLVANRNNRSLFVRNLQLSQLRQSFSYPSAPITRSQSFSSSRHGPVVARRGHRPGVHRALLHLRMAVLHEAALQELWGQWFRARMKHWWAGFGSYIEELCKVSGNRQKKNVYEQSLGVSRSSSLWIVRSFAA